MLEFAQVAPFALHGRTPKRTCLSPVRFWELGPGGVPRAMRPHLVDSHYAPTLSSPRFPSAERNSADVMGWENMV